jgi:hypothetical protein
MRSAPSGQARHRPERRHTRLALRVVLAMVTTFVFLVGWSVDHALTAPGGGTVAQRLAEWARNHNLGALVTFGEWLSYNPPRQGGKLDANLNNQGGTVLVSCRKDKDQPRCKKTYQGIQPIVPADIGSPAGRPLPGEGVWKVAVSVKGVPALFKTYVRESKTLTSYYAGIVSMDQRLLKFYLRPGTDDPGYGFGAPMDIPPGHRRGLAATFNSGFRVASALGGLYLNGHYDGSLVKGAASEVYYRDGRMAIGRWGYGPLHLSPSVVAVRQNLKPIVVNGQVPASVNQNVISNWGATLGGGYFVWRSGVGITKDGRIVFVYGPALDAQTLADLLKRAGCWTAMELDINPDWMSFMYYVPSGHPANPTPRNLLSSQVQPPYRYYTISSRDFTAVFAR